MKKIVLMILIVSSLLSCLTFYVGAEPGYEIEPYFSNVKDATLSFSIFSTGLAAVGITYNGFSDVFTQVRCEITLQKRYLGLFWFDVDNGMPDNTWVDYSTNSYGGFYHEMQLSDTGTYRAVFKVYFYGTTGVVDEISDKIEDQYE